MLAMETWRYANDIPWALLPWMLGFLVLVLVLFHKPIGKLLVRLESLQTPFLVARFSRERSDGGSIDSDSPPVVRSDETGSLEGLSNGDSPRIDSDVNRRSSVGASEGEGRGADSPP